MYLEYFCAFKLVGYFIRFGPDHILPCLVMLCAGYLLELTGRYTQALRD